MSAQDFNGIASFDYTVADEHGRESTATVTVEVLPTNDAPVANDDTLDVLEDQSRLDASLLLANDFDIDGDDLTIVSVGPLLDENGDPVDGHTNPYIVADQVFLELDGNYFGIAGFSYTVADPSGETFTANVYLNVAEVNDVPTARSDSYTTRQGDPVTILISDLLENDTDVDGDVISFISVQDAVNGTIELQLDGAEPAVIFTPDADYLGGATFTYTISDGRGGVTTSIVDVDVIPQNDPPQARDDSYNSISALIGIEDGALLIDPAILLANDSDPNGDIIEIIDVSRFSENGDVFLREDGIIVFTPFENYNGEASFTYTISDGRGGEDTTTATLFFEPLNDGPIVENDFVARYEQNGIFVITAAEIFANDSDSDGDVLFVNSIDAISAIDGATGEEVGVSLSMSGDNIVASVSDPEFFGLITISYTAVDTLGGVSQNSGIIQLTVLPQRETAAEVQTEVTMLENQTLSIRVSDLIAQSDFEGDMFDVASFEIATAGSYTLTPQEGVLFADTTDRRAGQNLTVDIPLDLFDGLLTGPNTINLTALDGGALPSWIVADGLSLTVSFPDNFSGSYDILATVETEMGSFEQVIRIFHGNENRYVA